MKTSDIKPNTLISFNYKKSHPKEDRLFYVSKVDSTSITGTDLSYLGVTIKKFLTAHIVNLTLIPSAKLPIEAKDYAYEIFANMLQEDECDIIHQEIFGELIGYVEPKNPILFGHVSYIDKSVTFNFKEKDVKLRASSDGILSMTNGTKLKTPQELAQYILTNLS